MDKHVLIVAAGSGSRMKSETPKQFMILNEKPILLHTLEAFWNYDNNISITIVLSQEHVNHWEALTANHHVKIRHKVVIGGATRFESVNNGINSLAHDGQGIVAIHDGARPLVTSTIIDRTFNKAKAFGNATASVSLKDSLRQTHDNGNNSSVNREQFRIVQTPQTFNISLIKKAFANASPHKPFTDDASVLEDLGEKIVLTEGGYENIKITTPEDLIMAQAILNGRNKKL